MFRIDTFVERRNMFLKFISKRKKKILLSTEVPIRNIDTYGFIKLQKYYKGTRLITNFPKHEGIESFRMHKFS